MTLKQLFSKFSILSGSNLLGMLASFGAVLIIIQIYGAEAFGRISLVLSITQYLVLLTGGGIENYLIREVAAKRLTLEQTLPNLIILRVLASAVILLVLFISVQLIPSLQEQASLFYIMSLSIIIVSFKTTWVAQSKHKSHVLGFYNLGIDLSFFLFLCLAFIATISIEGILWIKVTTEAVITVIFLSWTYKNYGPFDKPKISKQLFKLARNARHFAAYPFLRGLGLASDLVILSLFVSTIELGFYSAAFKVFFLLLSFSTAYIVIIFPRLSELSSQSLKASTSELMKFYRNIMPIAIIGGIIGLQLSEFGLALLFGENFIVATASLQILIIAFIANLAAKHYRQFLLISNNQKYDSYILLFSSIIHIASKFMLIPIMGISGAALGTAIGEIAMLIAYIFITSRLLKN